MTGKEFAAGLNKLAEALDSEVSTVIRKVTIDVWGRLTEETPVLSGRARASWRIRRTNPGERAVGVKPPGTYARPTEPEGLTSQRNVEGAAVLYIVNGLPYIQRLNDGWSQKAPAGFVEMAVAEVLASVDVELEALLLKGVG